MPVLITSELLDNLKKGNEEAFTAIFNDYFQRLCNFAITYVIDESTAKNIVQDVFIKLWENRKNIRENFSFLGYLLTITKNSCLDYLKHVQIENRYQKQVASYQSELELNYLIWDLHRPENKLIAANKEVIMGMPNRGSTAESMIEFLTLRIFGPSYTSGSDLKTPDGKQAVQNYARNNSNYRQNYDYIRSIGRGVATWRLTWYATHDVWKVNGIDDQGDLRHSSAVGNWGRMDSIKYNDPSSTWFGKKLLFRHPTTGALLCTDSLRVWFDWPHYKIYLQDVIAEGNQGSNQFNGATNGSNADWYLYRLSEAYLLRAEAKFYLGDNAGAAADVNEVRKRAKCQQLYTTVSIGDIMDERARELYLEEWRNVELKRVSYCLSLSGKPDEWGNTYDINTFDKQDGTDVAGGSYWYQRLMHYSMYNKGVINVRPRTINYRMDKHNFYWPIPNAAITANNQGKLHQNFGYDGYDASIPMWETWQDAVADEDKTSN